jgi:hypothetical protein
VAIPDLRAILVQLAQKARRENKDLRVQQDLRVRLVQKDQ